jgi:hypothetical protein
VHHPRRRWPTPPVAAAHGTDNGRLIDDDPKSRAGTRTVAFPAEILPELADHLARFADS